MNDDHVTDTLRSVLDDPPVPASIVDGAQWTARATQTVRRRRRARNLTVGALAAAAVAAGIIVPTALTSSGGPHATQEAGRPDRAVGDTPTPTDNSPVTLLPETTIVNTIMSAAAHSGDATPTAIQYVHGTRGPLVTAASGGDQVENSDSSTPVALVQAVGTFTIQTSGIAGPDGDASRSGTAIALVLDEKTGDVLDQGILSKPIDIALLGQIVHPAVPK